MKMKMKIKTSIYLLIALLVFVKSDDDLKSKKLQDSENLDSAKKVTKEKRQLDEQQSNIQPQQHNSQQQSETVYGSSQPRSFVLRAYNGAINNRRSHAHLDQQFLQQPLNEHQGQSQSEQVQEAAQQQYIYLPEGAQQQSSLQFRPLLHSKHGQPRKPQSIRPIQQIQQIPQYSPHPYPIIPEDQLLKLLEEELANKGIVNIQQVQQQQAEGKHVHMQIRKQQAHSQNHAQAGPTESQSKQGLGNYRHQQPEESVEYVYLPQQQQAQPLQTQQYYGPQHLHQLPHSHSPIQNQQQLYQQSQPLDYHRNILNHPLAASSLEKEIEKLFASNKPNYSNFEQQQGQYAAPHVQHHAANPKQQKVKSYGTNPTPTEKNYSFEPNIVEYSGFKQPLQEIEQEPSQQETSKHQTRHYLPKVYQTRTQYLKETLPQRQSHRTKPQSHQQSSLLYQKPQLTQAQYFVAAQPQQKHQTQSAQSQFTPIVNPTNSKNAAMKIVDAPSLQYEKPRNNQQPKHVYYIPEEQSIEQQPTLQPLTEPHSSVYISQSSGVNQPTPQPSQQLKSGFKGKLRLPNPNSKPITQEEFQALVDAGYPVQAVPVPVPVPYEKYIKDHPEYKYQTEQLQQQQSV